MAKNSTDEAQPIEPKMKKCPVCKIELDCNTETHTKRGSLAFHQNCFEKYQADNTIATVKAKDRKCPACKDKVNPLSDDAIDIGAATLHIECHKKNERKKKNREELLDYISLKYNIEFPTGFMLRQIKEFEKKGYSFKGITTTLKYIFEVEMIPPKEGTGIGLVAHYYEKAKLYHKKMQVAGQSAKNVTINNTPQKIVAYEPKTKRTRHFDMNDM